MDAKGGRVAMRWATLLQVILLLPPTLAGSICQHEDRGATFEFGCVCVDLGGPSGTDAAQLTSTPECGPCRDVTITAVAGPRVSTPGFQLANDIHALSDHLEMRRHSSRPGWHRLFEDASARPLSILRC